MGIAITVNVEPPPGATHYAMGSGKGPSTVAWYRLTPRGPGGQTWEYWSEDHRVWWFYGYERNPAAVEIRAPDPSVPTAARLELAGPVGSRDVVFVPHQLSNLHGEDLVRRSDHEAALGAVAREAAELRQRLADILSDARAV